MTEKVLKSRHKSFAIISVNNPPVNAIDQGVRQGIKSALQELRGQPEVKAIILRAEGQSFSAGADIKEFETGIKVPAYHEVLGMIEGFDRPVIAAIHGSVIAGGVELALACHYRCAATSAKISFPEVHLGIIPGAGGTQRLPRLIGLKPASELIVTGRRVRAKQAHELGLIDEVVNDEKMLDDVFLFAEKLIDQGGTPRRTCDLQIDYSGADSAFFEDLASEANKRMRGQQAPHRALELLQSLRKWSFSEGLDRESTVAQELLQSEQARALRHIFFAEREVSNIPGLPENVEAISTDKIGVIGAGTMGSGITMAFLNAGWPVTVVEQNDEALERGLTTIRKTYEGSVKKGKLSESGLQEILNRLKATLDYEAIKNADLIVEAVFENMELKKKIFKQLDKICDKKTILATNTSSLDVNQIAEETNRPERVIGLHFFSPAHIMKLMEIVRTKMVSDEVLFTAVQLSKRIRKVGVVSGVCFGFIGNRMLMDGYLREADHMLIEGATPEQIDKVIFDFGFPMGPFQMYDMAGIDVGSSVCAELLTTESRSKPYNAIASRLVEMGRTGQKTGRGFYRYEKGDRRPKPDPDLLELLSEEAKKYGVKRRDIPDKEIQERIVFSLINIAANILHEKIAYRSGDIDIVWTFGYGFPAWRGGPLFYADQLGLDRVLGRIEHYRRQLGNHWKPSPLLKELEQKDRGFGSWKI